LTVSINRPMYAFCMEEKAALLLFKANCGRSPSDFGQPYRTLISSVLLSRTFRRVNLDSKGQVIPLLHCNILRNGASNGHHEPFSLRGLDDTDNP
jgi:hypothetical protein